MTFAQSLWEFLNSAIGISLVLSAMAYFMGKIFTAKPTWQAYYDQYKPLLMQAVKFAEKQIPTGTQNAGLARADAALKYIISLDEHDMTDKTAISQALTTVHTELEGTGENL